MTLWIAVPEDQRQQATRALVDADVTVQGTWTGPTPGSATGRDPGGTFLFASLGLILLGLGVWAAWHGGWWIILAVVAVLFGLVCITAALARPPSPKTKDAVSRE